MNKTFSIGNSLLPVLEFRWALERIKVGKKRARMSKCMYCVYTQRWSEVKPTMKRACNEGEHRERRWIKLIQFIYTVKMLTWLFTFLVRIIYFYWATLKSCSAWCVHNERLELLQTEKTSGNFEWMLGMEFLFYKKNFLTFPSFFFHLNCSKTVNETKYPPFTRIQLWTQKKSHIVTAFSQHIHFKSLSFTLVFYVPFFRFFFLSTLCISILFP